MLLPHALRATPKGPPPPLPLAITYTGTATSATTSATRTFDIDIGTADVNRWVILVIRYPRSSVDGTQVLINSATINGVSATIAWTLPTVGLGDASSGNLASPTLQSPFVSQAGAGCVYAKVPNGTGTVSCTIQLSRTTISSTTAYATIVAYAVYGRENLSFTGGTYNTVGAFSSTTAITSPSNSTPANGFNMYYGYVTSLPTTTNVLTSVTWSGSPSQPTNSSELRGNGRAISSVRNNLSGGSAIANTSATLNTTSTTSYPVRLAAAYWVTS